MARSVRMNNDEAWAVLESAHTGVLTSLRADGWPISLPVWFGALDRRIYVAGQAHTKKFRAHSQRSEGVVPRRVR